MLQATFTSSAAQTELLVRVLQQSREVLGLEQYRATRLQQLAYRWTQYLVGGLGVALPIAAVVTGASFNSWQIVLVAVLAYISGGMTVLLAQDRKLQPVMAALIESSHPITYTLAPDGVTASVNMTTSFTPWKAVRKVLLTNDFVLLLRDDAVMHVPKDAFTDEKALLAFTSYASSQSSASA